MVILLHLNSPLSDLFFINLRRPIQRPVDWRFTIAEKGQQILGRGQLYLVFEHFISNFCPNFFLFYFLSKPAQKRNQSSSHQWTAGAVYYSGIPLSRSIRYDKYVPNHRWKPWPHTCLCDLWTGWTFQSCDDWFHQTGTNDLPQSVQVKYVVLFFSVGWFVDWSLFK